MAFEEEGFNIKEHGDEAKKVITNVMRKKYESIELFSHIDRLVTVLLDTMRYENPLILEKSLKLLVHVRSPTNHLLELLPKSSITLSKTEFHKRQKITEDAQYLFKASGYELSLEAREDLCGAMETLQSYLLCDNLRVVDKARQKLLFEMGTVTQVIKLLCEPMSNLITRPIDPEALQQLADSVDKMKGQAFSLLKLLITGLRPAQNLTMGYFKELISVQGEGELPDRLLELNRVLALNEVFTANTNLCIKVDDETFQVIFDKLLSLVNVSSELEMSLTGDASYRYLELLENILDLEESDQVLYKLQASVLRCIRTHWEELNGSIGESKSQNLLVCRQLKDIEDWRDLEETWEVNCKLEASYLWRDMFFVKMLSLMACCALGSLKSSITICKELVSYGNLKTLMESCKKNVLYFNSLSRFFLNVYVKSATSRDEVDMLSDGIKFIEIGEVLTRSLYDQLVTGTAQEKLDKLNSIKTFELRLKLLSHEEKGEDLDRTLDCVFNAVLPLVKEIFRGHTATQLNEEEAKRVEGSKPISTLISTSLRDLLKVTSNFLSHENSNTLLAAIEAVNGYRPENKATRDLVVGFGDNTLRKINVDGTTKEKKGANRLAYKEILINDVLELQKVKSLERAAVMDSECNRINKMFQSVVQLFKKTVLNVEPDFFSSSEELEVLGKTILGTTELPEDSTELSTLPTKIYKAPAEAVSGAKDIILQNIYSSPRHITLKYTDPELWNLLHRVFEWLRHDDNVPEFVVIQLLNSLTLRINDYKIDKQLDADLPGKKIIDALIRAGLLETLSVLITQPSAAKPATTCLCSLLRFPEVQKQMLVVCRSNRDPIFEWVWSQINTAILGYTQLNQAQSVVSTDTQLVIDIDTATAEMRLAIMFVGRLSNKTNKLQDYLRNQDNKIVTRNFLTALLDLLKNIPAHDLIVNAKSNSDSQKTMKQHNKMVVETLTALVNMLSTNTKSKQYAIELGVIESLDLLLLGSSMDKGTELRSLVDSGAVALSDLIQIRISCYDVLIALLEYDQELGDVGEKISDSLNVHELQLSVNEHLKLMDEAGDSEIRELASMATFKGYNVLKKMSMLEDLPTEQKSLQIDKSIENNVDVEWVEVVWSGSLERLYFPSKSHDLIRRQVKDEMLWGLNRKSQRDKNVDFLYWAEEILTDMENVEKLKSKPLISHLYNLEFLWHWCVLLLAIIIQLWLLVDPKLSDFGSKAVEDKSAREAFKASNYILGGLHLLSVVLLIATYVLTNYHRFKFPSFNWRELIFGKSSEQSSQYTPITERMTIHYNSFYHFWLLIMIIFSVLGVIFKGQLFCIHLLHIVVMFDLLTRVIKGATANREQLLVIIPFAVFIIYIYSMIYSILIIDMFDDDNQYDKDDEHCGANLFECFTTAMKYSLGQGSLGPDYKDLRDVWLRLGVDAIFWLLFSIIGLNVITALVLDGFSSQKSLRESSLEDMDTVCSICGLTKDQLATQGIDYKSHIGDEHSLWSYVTLFYYLKNTKKLSAIEEDVWKKFKGKIVDFLPRETSLSWKRALQQREEMLKKL